MGQRSSSGRVAHALAIIAVLALGGVATAPAFAGHNTGHNLFITNCTGCHATPTSFYITPLNAANAGNIIQHALNQNMTGLGAGLPVVDTTAIASYIQESLTALGTPPTQNVAFNPGGGLGTTFTLPSIYVPSPYGAVTGIATVSSPNGGVAYSGSDATFTPTACFIGAASFTYRGTGPNGNTSTRSQAVSVGNPTAAPSISTAAPPGGQTGVAYSHDVNVSQCESIATYSVTAGALPTGLLLSTSGVISGTPTTTGAFTGTITATYPGGLTGTQNFSITIALGPPAFTSGGTASNTSVGIASANAYTAAAQYGTMTFGISGQPPGLSINATSGVVSGTPTDASGSPYSATVSATNSNTTTNRTVVFNVVPAISSAATASGQTGVATVANCTMETR